MVARALYRRFRTYTRKNRGPIRNTLRVLSALPGVGGYVTAARRVAGFARRVGANKRIRKAIRNYRRR